MQLSLVMVVSAVVALLVVKPSAAVSLQSVHPAAPCEDLSPHCPSLCEQLSCEDSQNAAESPVDTQEPLDFVVPEIEPVGPPPARTSQNGTTAELGQSVIRPKRYAKHSSGAWVKVVPGKSGWLPSWVPSWVRPLGLRGKHSQPGSNGDQDGVGADSDEEVAETPLSEIPSKECGDLVDGGRQLIEAFCPKSCGRCGKSSDPTAAAKIYVDAQCTVAKGPAVGLAKQ